MVSVHAHAMIASYVAQVAAALAASGKVEEASKTKSCGTRIFEDEFPFKLVVKRLPTRLASIGICLVLLILACVSAVGIAPQTATEEFLPDDHPFQRYSSMSNEFEASNLDTTVEINMVRGGGSSHAQRTQGSLA